jgi:hypothetical protein
MPNADTKRRLVITLVIATCLVGLFLRVYFFVINRSLWLDEAVLALNLVHRSFLGLLEPLDFNQGAPVGFLLLQKAVICLLGSSDYILRLVPLLAGLASVPLMYVVSKRYGGQLSVFISLGLFALSPRLVYYSSEVKQYSTDVLITLVLLLIAQKCLEDQARPRALVVLGIVGSLATWVSHPSVFVSAGILLALGLAFAVRRDSQRLFWLMGVGLAWGISLGLIYWISLRYLESNDSLLNYWSGSFAPLLPWGHLSWYYSALTGMLRDPAALPVNAIVLGLSILGILSLAFRRWQLMLVLVAPFGLTLMASAVQRYPFSGRLLLFLVPLVLLLLAEGVERVWRLLLRVRGSLAGLVSASLTVYLLYGPAAAAYENVRSPPLGEHIKPVMAYASEHYQSTDLIYVYYGASAAFEFYAPLYGFDQGDYVVGVSARNDPDQYLEDIEKIRPSQRVWFVFAHNCNWCLVNEQEFILEHLDEIGLKIDECESFGASIYLYDLRQIPQ